MSVRFFVLITTLTVTCYATIEKNNYESGTLKLVFALFRHGDRTNDAGTTWPKDPHKDEEFFPYGLGQLTNEGKQTEYKLGKKLRKRYNDFLGNLYTPDALSAVSTDYNRTKASLELVLAGLYPPKNTCLEWQKELNWQPIPYNYLPLAQDHLMSFPLYFCANYMPLFEAYRKSPEGQKVEAKYSDKFAYLSQHTGLNVTSLMEVNMIYFGLTSYSEWGFELPAWTDGLYPEYMENAAKDFYIFCTATPQLKQLTGGFLLNRIISDIQLKLDNKLIPPKRKLFLYSGHEINVAYLLRTMGVFSPHVPPYGACVIIELHTVHNVDGIKIYYENYSGAEPVPLKVPGCDYFCPFKRFVKLLHNNLPSSDNMCGDNSNILHMFDDTRSRYLGF